MKFSAYALILALLPAFASAELSQEEVLRIWDQARANEQRTYNRVLEALLRQSGELTLIDADGKPLPAEKQLAPLLAARLIGSNVRMNAGTRLFQSLETKVQCALTPVAMPTRKVTFDCEVGFLSAEYLEEKGQVRGPITQDSFSIAVNAEQAPDTGDFKILNREIYIKAKR